MSKIAAVKFTPEYLRQKREEKKSKEDADLIWRVKNQIEKENARGKDSTIISFKTFQHWETTVKFFEELGFYVGAQGNDYQTIRDEDGDECYLFLFNWHVPVED